MKQSFGSDTKKWGELHEHLQDLLAGYADDELDDAQMKLMDAHLAGCELCRNDLARQKIITERLEVIASPRLSNKANDDIDKSLASSSTTTGLIQNFLKDFFVSSMSNIKGSVSLPKVMGISGWGLATVLAIMIFMPTVTQDQNSQIPMISDALAEYHEHEDKILPISTNIDQNNKAPVSWPNAQLLAAWKTMVAGQTAEVYALRSGRNIVFQYHVNESVFFRNPLVRHAISKSGSYKIQVDTVDIMAMPLTSAGVLLVGPENSLPSPETMMFESI